MVPRTKEEKASVGLENSKRKIHRPSYNPQIPILKALHSTQSVRMNPNFNNPNGLLTIKKNWKSRIHECTSSKLKYVGNRDLSY